MYRLAPAPQPLPGTQLIQRIDGLGDYRPTPIYFATPAGQAGIRGLGCSGTCGCSDCRKGFGFFDSGIDFTGWGAAEWATVAVAGYLLASALFTTKRAVSYVASVPGRRRKSKAASLRAQAKELTKKRKGFF